MQAYGCRDRIIDEARKRAAFFGHIAALRGTRLHKLEYVIVDHTPDICRCLQEDHLLRQRLQWACIDNQEEEHEQWIRQTGAYCLPM
jgi:hypothetical protein